MTAYRRSKGRKFSKSIVEIGEAVWYLRPKSAGKKKLKSRWSTGIWLGARDESNEILIGTEEGVIKVRTVRRKGTNEERWNAVQVDRMCGTPWQPQPGIDSIEVKSKIIMRREEENNAAPELLEGVPRIAKQRRFKILKKDATDEYGPTEDCDGCRAAMFDEEESRNHSEKCRDRLAQLMMADGDTRVLRDADRFIEQ